MLLAWVAVLSCCLGARAEEAQFEGKISEVTVYTSGTAGVVRRGEINLQAGRNVIRSAPLPEKADPSSIQVKVGGGAKVEAVETRRLLVDEKIMEGKRAEHRELLRREEDKLFAAQQELQAINEKMQSRNETLDLLNKIRQQAAQTAGREMTIQKMNVEDWEKAVQFAESRSVRAREELISFAREQREAGRKLEEVQRAYNEAQNKYPKEIYEIRAFVTVACAQAVEAPLEVTYNVNGATWEPSYRAGADLKNKKVTLEVFGSVSQNSGEDWNNATLSLSTARPDLGTDVPVLNPWYIHVHPGQVARNDHRNITSGLNTLSFGLNAPIQQVEPSPKEEEDDYEDAPVTSVESGGMATVFTAQAPADIPSDGQMHKIPVGIIRSPITIEHYSIPKILQHAFISAETVEKTPYPLLPGVVDVVVGDSFVGRGMMKLTAPGAKIKLGLGIDETVKISLRLLEDRVDRKRRGDRVATTNVFEINVTSYSTEEITLNIIDQLPVSKSGEVKIDYGREASRALRGAEFPGQLKWVRNLTPKGTDRIEFDFVIEYPEHLRQALDSKGNSVQTYDIDNVLQMEISDHNETNNGKVYNQPRFEKRREQRAVTNKCKF
jgi:uncharacterized protein (TIGR02231 family)